MQAPLPVVTVSAPDAPQLEDGAGGPPPAAFMKGPQPLQQPHIPLCAQKWGASSVTSGAISKGNQAMAAWLRIVMSLVLEVQFYRYLFFCSSSLWSTVILRPNPTFSAL